MPHNLLLYAGAVVLFVTFWARWMAWGILCICCNYVILDDALSSNLHNLIFQVASKFKIVVGIRDLLASRTSCPFPWFILVVFDHWWKDKSLCLVLLCLSQSTKCWVIPHENDQSLLRPSLGMRLPWAHSNRTDEKTSSSKGFWKKNRAFAWGACLKFNSALSLCLS